MSILSLCKNLAAWLRPAGFAALVALTGLGGVHAGAPLPTTLDPSLFTTTCSNVPGQPATWTIWAGQTTAAGTVSVSNDTVNLYVTYTIDTTAFPNGHFGALHLWVGTDPSNIPATGTGNPIPGQFPYKYNEADVNGVYPEQNLTTYTFVIPLADLSIVDVTLACGLKLYVVAHSEVFYDTGFDGVLEDTGFGGDQPGPTGNRWWFYGLYCINCDNFDQPEFVCKTAFAKGGFVFVTDKKSNPENLPSLKLSKNRWGWAINLTSTGTTTYDIWAGAGLNYTSKGKKVGTLTVVWDGNYATITYALTVPNVMDEVHIYAGDFKPTTAAPGQYGNLAYFDPSVGSYTTDPIAVSDTNGDGIWIIAHAVACWPI